jgi:tetratricopeptide (TPR) repeat protein
MRLAVAVLAAGLLAACDAGDPAVRAERDFLACQSSADVGGRAAACSAVIRNNGASSERRALAFFNRGMVRMQALEMTRAVMDFSRAIRLDPNLAEAYYQRGYAHHENGSFDAAIADYDRALSLNPNHYEASQRRAIALSGNIRDFATRLAVIDSRIEADPNNPGNYNNRCWERAVEGVELERALADCDRSLALAPDDPQTLDSRGLVHFKMGNYQQALIDYEAASRADPNSAHFLYGRGLSKFYLGNATDGLADMNAAIALDPIIASTYARYGVAQPQAVATEKL